VQTSSRSSPLHAASAGLISQLNVGSFWSNQPLVIKDKNLPVAELYIRNP
jgi:hypothetical protein